MMECQFGDTFTQDIWDRRIAPEIKRRQKAGKLPEHQRGCFLRPRPKEELYDVEKDPHSLKNLAADPAYRETLAALRRELDRWIDETGDRVPQTPTPDRFDRWTGKPKGK